MPGRAPTPEAERQRRHRERRQQGIQIIQVEVDIATLEALIDRGFLRPYDEDDPECIARALVDAVRE